jgi:uncharacterized protein DUF2752
VALIGPLVLAGVLTPSPRGIGTHRQLGLPRCSFEQAFNIPCPGCGSTTAFAHFADGQIGGAFEANIGATVLAFIMAILGPWMIATAAVGRWLGPRPALNWVLLISIAIVAVQLIDWAVRMSTDMIF